MSIKLRYLSFLFVFLFVGQNCRAQFEIPPKPNFQTSVYDYTDLLTPNESKALEQKLIKYADSTSTQIVVATINSTEGEYINYLATNLYSRQDSYHRISNTDGEIIYKLVYYNYVNII